MKATLKNKIGESKGELELPSQFHEEIRPDLIKRAVLAMQSHSFQPKGTDPEAGMRYSSKLSRRRRDYKTAYGIGISRVPRKILNYRGTRFNWQAATVPLAVGGREAHPPKSEKILSIKINKKERRKAIRSAMAASIVKEIVAKRGHIINEYPLILENDVENFKKAKEVIDLMVKLGLNEELKRAAKKSQKTGKAKSRGRTFKGRKGPLIVVSKKCDLINAAFNLPGIEVVEVKSLNAELLAPGCDYGRLTLYTKGAIELLDKLKLFTEYTAREEKEAKKSEVKQIKKTKETLK